MEIPLIMDFPGNQFAGREVFSRVSLIDVFPTILDYLSLPSFPGAEGISLLPVLRGSGEVIPERLIFSEMFNPELDSPKLSAIYAGDWKLVKQASPRRIMLFNLDADPKEKDECATAYLELKERLESALEEWEDSHPQRYFKGAPPPESGELRQLKALGYIN